MEASTEEGRSAGHQGRADGPDDDLTIVEDEVLVLPDPPRWAVGRGDLAVALVGLVALVALALVLVL